MLLYLGPCVFSPCLPKIYRPLGSGLAGVGGTVGLASGFNPYTVRVGVVCCMDFNFIRNTYTVHDPDGPLGREGSPSGPCPLSSSGSSVQRGYRGVLARASQSSVYDTAASNFRRVGGYSSTRIPGRDKFHRQPLNRCGWSS